MCISDLAGETLAPLPVVQHDGPTAIAKAFGVPDVSKIDLSKLSPADQATLVAGLQAQLRNANAHWNALLEPVQALSAQAQRNVFDAIKESGGSALAHDHLDVHLEQPTKIDDFRDVALLRTLENEIPADEFREAVYRGAATIPAALTDEQISVIEKIVGGGVKIKAEWKTDAAQLKKIVKKYGENSAAGQIIAKGLRREKVSAGSPYLVIQERPETAKPWPVVASASVETNAVEAMARIADSSAA